MADIVRIRARRFKTLYQLLTGVDHADLPLPYTGSDHLRKDIGLPEQACVGFSLTLDGTYRTDAFCRLPQYWRSVQ